MYSLECYICYVYRSGKEDQSFAKERDAQRKQFDKKTGKAVTVTGPKNKPDSVCIPFILLMSIIGLLRSR